MPCSNINIASWARDVESPMVLIDRVVLVKVELKELVMSTTFIIFVPSSNQFYLNARMDHLISGLTHSASENFR